jgi:predicted GNAT family acetyltransferase
VVPTEGRARFGDHAAVALTFHRLDTVDEFLALTGNFLAEREAEHNLLWGISSGVRDHPEIYAEGTPSFGAVTDAGGRIFAATLRTPPFNQVLSEVDDLEAVDRIVDALVDEPLPGVLGPTEAAARFASRWAERTGHRARRATAERVFRLDRVVPPMRPAPGGWRPAEPRDRELVAEWVTAFSIEVDQLPPSEPLATADRWIAGEHRRLYLWEDDGAVVSIAGAGGATPNGIRIGPVYTPPDLRGRGYASAVTAAATQDQLDRGRRFVFLFTDLANPTSNKIYRAIGYEPVCDVDEYRFEPDA